MTTAGPEGVPDPRPRVRAIAALEVPPHDPVVEYPAVGAGQQQVGSFGAGQPANVLTGADVDFGAGVLPPQVLRQRLRYHPDPADRHAAGDRCADHIAVSPHSYAPVSPVACHSAKPFTVGS